MSFVSMRTAPNSHHPLVEPRNQNNATLRNDLSSRYSVRWRSNTVWSKRKKLLSKREETGLPECRSSVSTSCNRGIQNYSDPKYRYGNICNEPDERTVFKCSQAMESSDKRNINEARWHHHVAVRHFWDHSLKTTSLALSRDTSTSRQAHKLITAPPCVFPRISRSAETTSGYDIPTRYPRGQQRPSGLASGHLALKLRHKQILEASRQRETTWPQLRANRRSKGQNTNVDERHSPNYYDVTMQPRCSREAKEKCRRWFSTWLDE